MSKTVNTTDESLAEEMISANTDALSSRDGKPTFWQSYKKILIPAAVATATVTAVGTGLAVYFTKNDTPTSSPDTLSISWGNATTFSNSSVIPYQNSSEMLEYFESYLFNASNMVASIIGALSSDALKHFTSPTCPQATLPLVQTIDAAMDQGGTAIIQNISGPIGCEVLWSGSIPKGLTCVYLKPNELFLVKSTTTICNTQSLSSRAGFLEMRFDENGRNVLISLNGLPHENNPSPSPTVIPVPPSTLTPAPYTPIPSNNYPVGNCTFFEEYLLSHPLVQQFFIGVICNSTLILNLPNSNITDIGVAAIVPALQQLTVLQDLDLYGNNLGDAGVIALAPALEHMINLQKLYLDNNNIGSQGATSLAAALQHQALLIILSLSNNNITDEGITELVPALQQLRYLESLDLSHNNLSYKGIADLVPALKQMIVIEALVLGYNNIGSQGATSLAAALRYMPNLVVLNLDDNNLGDQGVSALFLPLQSAGLMTLQLHNNSITDQGATALAPALQQLTYLQSLDLSNNFIGPQGASVLGKALGTLQSLGDVDLQYNNIGLVGCTDFTNAIHVNNTDAGVLCN